MNFIEHFKNKTFKDHPIEHQSAFFGIGAALVTSSFQPISKSALFGIVVAALAYVYLSSTSFSAIDVHHSELPSSSSQSCPSCPIYATITKCVASDGSTVANLKCPLGKTIKVVDVFYGRDSAITCQLSQGGYPDPTIFTPAKSPPGALDAVKAICDGKNNANVPLNESTFGPDLYPGVSKYVRIVYTCV